MCLLEVSYDYQALGDLSPFFLSLAMRSMMIGGIELQDKGRHLCYEKHKPKQQ